MHKSRPHSISSRLCLLEFERKLSNMGTQDGRGNELEIKVAFNMSVPSVNMKSDCDYLGKQHKRIVST